MKKIFLILFIILILPLAGIGCKNNKQKTIDKEQLIQVQQKQIENLNQKMEEFKMQLATTSQQITNTQQKINTAEKLKINYVPKEDPQIKIERCKTEAKILSDNKTYLTEKEINDTLREVCKQTAPSPCVDEVFEFLDEQAKNRENDAYSQYYISCLNN